MKNLMVREELDHSMLFRAATGSESSPPARIWVLPGGASQEHKWQKETFQ